MRSGNVRSVDPRSLGSAAYAPISKLSQQPPALRVGSCTARTHSSTSTTLAGRAEALVGAHVDDPHVRTDEGFLKKREAVTGCARGRILAHPVTAAVRPRRLGRAPELARTELAPKAAQRGARLTLYCREKYNINVIDAVVIAPKAQKALRKLPTHIVDKLLGWVLLVKARGLEEAQRIPGLHDEPLRGQRAGQRSIRLNRAYRAIYVILRDGSIEFVSVEEVHKHDY